jgi:PAS domain S-box-containing protein
MKLSAAAKAMFDAVDNPVVIVQSDDRIALANDAFERLSGWKRKHLEGKRRLSDFISSDTLQGMFNEDRAKQNRNKDSQIYEFIFHARSGSVTPVKATISAFPGKGARLISFRTNEPDYQVKDLMHQGMELFRQFFEQNEEAIIVLQPETCAVMDVNRAACRLFGYNHDALVDGGLTLFCEPNELDNLKRIVRRPDSVEQPYVMSYFRHDGTKRDRKSVV